MLLSMTEENQQIKRIIVLGGGSAGFMAALALRVRMPDLAISVIRSKDIGIIGVGESSTVNLTEFLHRYLRINPKKFFDIAKPVWKMGLKFIWGSRPHFYYPFDAMQLVLPRQDLPKPLSYYCDDDMDCAEPMSALMANNRVFYRGPNGDPQFHNSFAYHLDNGRYVAFLEAFAQSVNIQIIEDTVAEVKQNEAGVSGLVLQSGRTEAADLYVDSSGFVSLLLGKTFKEPFVPFKSSLLCDRAVVGSWMRQPGEPIQPYTTCETMNVGWCWQIDHVERIDRGYVYCSSFISQEEAEREYRAAVPKAGPTRIVKFVSGRYERNWVKNVVAVGNASGFVEPLESTGLGMVGVQSRLLADSLVAADRQIRDGYRKLVNQHHNLMWDSIRGFIAIHFKFNTRLDTPFWRECREKTDIASAAPLLEFYQENGPDGLFGQMIVGPHDPFTIGGWVNLLLGQRVPYRHKHQPTPSELQTFNALRQKNRAMALQAMTSEEILATIPDPNWRWQ
jgi:tryptophan halogenase